MRPENSTNDKNELSFIEKARRAQIVESAIITISTLGYAKASLAQIAIRAGISKGVISYHFAGKEELIQQVVTEVYAAAAANMGPQIQAESTAATRLKAYIESNLAFMRNYRKHIVALHEIWSNRRSNDSASSLIMMKHESGLCDLERLLVHGQDTGEFRDFNPRTLAAIIRNTIDMASHQSAANEDFDWDEFARELVALFSRATYREI